MATVRVESIAAGGDGVGRLDGLAVFVPRTAPAELVEVTLRKQGRMARGSLVRVIEPSPQRVNPRCRHYDGDRCGGCQLQHLSMPSQLAAKQRIVQDAFSRIARRAVELPPIVSSPSAWEYRSRLTLAMRWQHGGWVMGLHAFDDVDRVFDLRECPITDARIVAAWADIRRAAHLLPRAAELRATVRLAGQDLALILEGADVWPAAREFAAVVPVLNVIRWRPAHGSPRVILDRHGAVTPHESFDQVNQPVAAAARQELVERAMAASPRTAIDAYAGLGATSLALTERGVQVTAIEADEAASRYAAHHLSPASRVVTGRVEDVLPEYLPADVVILNPPRAGIDARVAEALQSPPWPRRLLYMSCDPATLARDVSRLPVYRVSSLRAYDMFPQTSHVEVVCELIPEEA
jgi:23S rRNA (uracil1939-C5)-methyltransferase